MTFPSDQLNRLSHVFCQTMLAVAMLAFISLPAHAQDADPGHSKGAEDAPVTLVEYGSVTCSTCKYFHEEVLAVVAPEFIEDGRLRFVFREYTRHSLDTELMVLARCAGPDRFFDVVDDAFARQDEILQAAQSGAMEEALKALGERHGIDRETGFETCRNNFDIRFDISIVKQSAALMGIEGTPTFLINGTLVPWGPQVSTPEAFARALIRNSQKQLQQAIERSKIVNRHPRCN